MKKYCFDTSGISNPLEMMPEDIYDSMWAKVTDVIITGCIAVTKEIYDEMKHIPGQIGACIKSNEAQMLLEVGKKGWNWEPYVKCAEDMQISQRTFISEYNGGSKRTVCLNDISIIALAKVLVLPVVSMETLIRQPEAKWRRIPNVCMAEHVEHLSFNDFLRRENVRL
jgi:hypothetical protein